MNGVQHFFQSLCSPLQVAPEKKSPPLPRAGRVPSTDLSTPILEKLFARSVRPLIDAESERRVVRLLIPVVISFFIAGLILYFLPAGLVSSERAHPTCRRDDHDLVAS
jgi:hypothetical protein